MTRKNRLQFETSPYLKQHEDNPVDWYPWTEEALQKAKSEDKPILLSVGYSACHWCHVMAHESFENPQIAQIMNERFINIKVDREERPDLDQIYQPVAQMITRGGGWPLTVFLTPDLKPFYGGTYFPPSDRYGRPGFPKLLVALSEAYQKNRNEIVDRAEKMTEVIQESDDFSGNEDLTQESVRAQNAFSIGKTKAILQETLKKLLTYVDWEQGGFGGAPKFPNAMALTFLWRMSQMEWVERSDRESARSAVHFALQKMACGGIFDQLGGGFHRYTVDAIWLVPHFEKMLYDNGLLLKLYSEVVLNDSAITSENKILYLDVIQNTVTYLEREMVSPEGLFYAAQDADSEGEEGKFFVWDETDLTEILTSEEKSAFIARFGVVPQGNFEHGKSVLTRSFSAENAELSELEQTARQKVFQARTQRIPPGLDNKALVSWNGLAISGLAWASLALQKRGNSISQTAKNLAVRAFAQITELASQTGAGLASTVQQGKSGHAQKGIGYLDDYAFLAQAALDLCRIDPASAGIYWKRVREWTEKLNQDFKDREGLGYYFTSGHHADLIHRPKSFFDQAIPSGNAVAYGLHVALQARSSTESVTSISAAHLEIELSILSRSFLENPYGLGEFMNTALLAAVGPVAVKGEFLGAHLPFCFLESEDSVQGQNQFCHRQTCQLGQFDFAGIFR